VLTIGTALSGLCFCLAGTSAGFAMLVAALLLGGIGASTQHPLASTLVARAFTGPRSLQAIGTYNFAGDIGKMIIPAAATTMLLIASWRSALAVLGAVGLLAAVAIYLLIPRFAPESTASGTTESAGIKGNLIPGYWTLLAIGALDSMTRAGFLVFLPFLMIEKGATVTTGGFALTLVFVGGAAGKLLCARLTRFGIVGTLNLTKTLTAVGMIALMYLPVGVDLALLPFFGAILNGPTSLTYGSVPMFIRPAGRSRAFSVFYTGTLGSAAIAPTISGVLGDFIGIHGTIVVMAALAMLTLPLAWQLRPALAAIENDAGETA
jgi:MFS family permease